MHTIAFLGLLKLSAVLIALVLAASIAAYGSSMHGMHDRAVALVCLEAVLGIALLICLWLIVREMRRSHEV